MKHIIDDKADIVNLNNEELYLAGRLYNLEPFAMEQYNGGKSKVFSFFISRASPLLVPYLLHPPPCPVGRSSYLCLVARPHSDTLALWLMYAKSNNNLKHSN